MKNKGFTLIELLVVIAIIGVLSSIVLSSVNGARARARDSKRRQDMVSLRTALELYRVSNGSYPLPSPGWWGGASTGPCGPGNSANYISGLVPNYMSSLPVDPANAPAPCTGYLYASDGLNYKVLVHVTPESYPAAGNTFYDPVRPTWSWMICSGEPACSSW